MEDDAETIKIRARVGLFTGRLFRARIVGSANHITHSRQLACRTYGFGDTKIGQYSDPIFTEKDVGRFYISVYKAPFMGVA